jgi:GNAT superfamily N-acetyltransferase
MSEIRVELASNTDVDFVSSILKEAAAWLADRGEPLWRANDLDSESIAGEVAAGMYWLAYMGGEPAGCLRYQLEDALVWPDAPLGEAAYIHRLAVRREFAGSGVSAALIDWAKAHARNRGHAFLRLDCDAERGTLRALYERHGFVEAGEQFVGPYTVIRYEFALAEPGAD